MRNAQDLVNVEMRLDPICLKRRSCIGISAVETIVGIVIIFVFFTMAYYVMASWSKPTAMRAIVNSRRLYDATQAMYLDGVKGGDTNLSWPGDSDGKFSTWAKSLVPSYLSTNEFCNFLSLRNLEVKTGKIPLMKDTALRVYGVRSNSGDRAVFLTSANFTNSPTGGDPFASHARLFRDDGFVVFRKGGDGRFYRWKEAGNTNTIGSYVPMLQE